MTGLLTIYIKRAPERFNNEYLMSQLYTIGKEGRGTLDEKYYDAMLNVLTREDRVINPFFQYYPYEPTPYAVLKQLSDTYPLTQKIGSLILDVAKVGRFFTLIICLDVMFAVLK